MKDFEQGLHATGALADDRRRRLYLYIRSRRRPVGRDEAAQAVGISHKLAAFHLDKLVDTGLLVAGYERLTGRTGPGAGRPAKVYEPSGIDVSVSIPFRSYDVVAEILLDVVAGERGRKRSSDVRAAARSRGEDVGDDARRTRSGRTSAADLAAVGRTLAERGYEPYSDRRGGLRLHNCPFHSLAQRSPELVCGINHAFIEGLLSGLQTDDLEAVLDPRPGECCVWLRAKKAIA